MNLHYEFWVRYYEFLLLSDDTKQICSIFDANKRIVESKWECSDQTIPFQEHSLCLKVQYPGMLVGLGYTHDSGVRPTDPTVQEKKEELRAHVTDTALKSEIGLGISLDHVTGLPVIPGSQVKGMLRSAFISNPAYIAEILKWKDETAEASVGKLEQDIFGGRHPNDSRTELETEHKGLDYFMDALPVETGKDKRLFGIENITPHLNKDKEYERLNSPNVLQLLKVIPGTVFLFRFILRDSVIDGHIIDRQKKLELFSNILEDMGIGAKTNVGFGSVHAVQKKDVQYTYLERMENNMASAIQEGSRRPAGVIKQPAVITRASQIQPDVQMKGRCLQDKKRKEVLLLDNPRIIGTVQGVSALKFAPGNDVQIRVISIRPNIVVEIL